MHEHSLLEGVLEVLASVGALVAKLLLDTHELVVLGSPLRAANTKKQGVSALHAPPPGGGEAPLYGGSYSRV